MPRETRIPRPPAKLEQVLAEGNRGKKRGAATPLAGKTTKRASQARPLCCYAGGL